MRLSLLPILWVGGVACVFTGLTRAESVPNHQARVMYQACLNGVEASLQAQKPQPDLDNLMAFHEKAQAACHCMAYDPAIIKATKRLASLQKEGKTAPFSLSEAYEALLMKTKERCFSKRSKKNTK